MDLDNKLEGLKTQHSELEVALEKENNHPHPDDVHIAGIKKQKLRIKDEIAALLPH